MKTLLRAAVLLALSTTAQAHEVWLERDGNGPVRIYLGEPGEPLPPGGDPEFGHLKTPKLLPASTAPQIRKAGYIAVAAPAGDVRVWDDTVFAPWGDSGKKEGIVYYARAGRREARAVMPFEIAPVASGGNVFVVARDGKPVPGARLTVITPDKWSRILVTGADGRVTVQLREPGRYILSATQAEKGDLKIGTEPVATLHRTATTSFLLP